MSPVIASDAPFFFANRTLHLCMYLLYARDPGAFVNLVTSLVSVDAS